MTVLTTEPMLRDAAMSPDAQYRYSLIRVWDQSARACAFVLLNPSTADKFLDDPTVRRCIGFARAWGYGGIVIVNLFALRATDPRELTKSLDPIGPDNDRWLLEGPAVWGCDKVVFAWGAHGTLRGRSKAVRRLFALSGTDPFGGRYQCFGLTEAGEPKHPLYLRADAPLIRWDEARRAAGLS